MSTTSEIFVAVEAGQQSQDGIRYLLEVYLVFGLLLGAIWTPTGQLNSVLVFSTAICVLWVSARGRWAASVLGLTRPWSGTSTIFFVGTVSCGLIAIAAIALRPFGPGYHVPLFQSGMYMLWSLAQEFILQSLFFLRFEALLGPRQAVFASAALFAVAHLPSPLLAVLSMIGGILFCELFRRYRNLYPIGLIHGALGLTIAAGFPDKWMHHMRVGVGYLAMR